MSNLQLDLSIDNIKRVADSMRTNKIGYATTVRSVGSNIYVLHHGNKIIRINLENSVATITGAGWNSRTTSDRLHRFLVDNNLPGRVYSRDNQKEYGLFYDNGRTKLDIQDDLVSIDLI